MSRHVIVLPSAALNVDVWVTMGYDRPLGHVFCSVLSATGSPPVHYCSSADPQRMNAQRVGVFAEPLAQLGITLPQVVLDNVTWDQKAGAGNLVYSYDRSGKLEEVSGDVKTLGPMIYNVAQLHSKILGRDVVVALGYQAGHADRVFSYIGNPDQAQYNFIDTSMIGVADNADALYCSMTDPDRMRATQIEQVLAPLNNYGITIPPGMVEELLLAMKDCRGESFTCQFNGEGELTDTDRGLDMCF